MREPFYIRVGRVAQIIGVCTETIRKRERSGDIVSSVRKGKDRRYDLFSLPISEEEKNYWFELISEQISKGKERAHSPEINCRLSLYKARKNNKLCVECGTSLSVECNTINCEVCKEKRKIKRTAPEAQKRAYEYSRRWVINNREKLNLRIRERERTDLQFKLRRRIRARLYGALKGRRRNSKTIPLGCSVDELKRYLENLFSVGMTWENYGKKENCWSIDHIIPLNSFDLLNEKEFIKAVHYTNLQPLWHKENLSKGVKLVSKANITTLEGEPRWE